MSGHRVEFYGGPRDGDILVVSELHPQIVFPKPGQLTPLLEGEEISPVANFEHYTYTLNSKGLSPRGLKVYNYERT